MKFLIDDRRTLAQRRRATLPEKLRQEAEAYLVSHYSAPDDQPMYCGSGMVMDAALPPEPSGSSHPGASAAKRPPAPGWEGDTPSARRRALSDAVGQVADTFQEHLLRVIDERGMTDTEVYKRAGLSRKLFSKIRCNPDYHPGKKTAVALAIALKLNLDETVDLLGRAGLALSPSSKFDLIIEFCIENRIYDLTEIDALLLEFEQEMLSA